MSTIQFLAMRFSLLSLITEELGRLHLLDINTVCEYFYKRLMNLLFGYNLTNINKVEMNAAGIDLIDQTAKIVIQISSENTKTKIQKSIDKAQSYTDYRFRYVCISRKLSRQRKNVFNSGALKFDAQSDLIDNKTFLLILLETPEKQKSVIELFDSFFPCFRFIFSEDKRKSITDMDERMLTDFFEYFSCNLMDDFLDCPERLLYEFNASWGIWREKWHMSSTYFVNPELSNLMQSFWTDWDTMMRDNENWYYESDIPGVHWFRNWHNGHCYNDPDAQKQHSGLIKQVSHLKESYNKLIVFIKNYYQLDLQGLSERFASSFK